MIKKYQNKETIMAEQFDGSDEMIKKYDLDYEYDLEGNKRFYGSFDGFLYAGDWIVSCPNYEIYPISDDVFKQTYKELNVKPVMPKVFDEWYKDVIKSYGGPNTRKTLAIVFNTLLTVDASIFDESESSLKNWLIESNSIEDLDRISKCIDAIRYGYEVEK